MSSVEAGQVPYPNLGEAFTLGVGAVGVHFYGPREAVYMPYCTLQGMHLNEDVLTVIFATDQIVIEGRGLHSLYAHLAEQRVKRVHEQGERYRNADNSPVYIAKIVRQPRPLA